MNPEGDSIPVVGGQASAMLPPTTPQGTDDMQKSNQARASHVSAPTSES